MQDVSLVTDLYGMSGVVSSLISDNPFMILGQKIDHLPLPFIPPLGSDKNRIGHVLPCIRPSRQHGGGYCILCFVRPPCTRVCGGNKYEQGA